MPQKNTLKSCETSNSYLDFDIIAQQLTDLGENGFTENLYFYIPLMERLVYEIINTNLSADSEHINQGRKRSLKSLLDRHQSYLIETLGQDDYKMLKDYRDLREKALKSIEYIASQSLICQGRELCYRLLSVYKNSINDVSIPRIERID